MIVFHRNAKRRKMPKTCGLIKDIRNDLNWHSQFFESLCWHIFWHISFSNRAAHSMLVTMWLADQVLFLGWWRLYLGVSITMTMNISEKKIHRKHLFVQTSFFLSIQVFACPRLQSMARKFKLLCPLKKIQIQSNNRDQV